MKSKKKYKFNENNSGGNWWLNKRQYEKLFAAGWKLDKEWAEPFGDFDPTKPWSESDDVPYGWRHNLYYEAYDIREAVESWENATGQDFFSEGCHCCGAPFSMRGEGEYQYLSGNSVDRVTVRPWHAKKELQIYARPKRYIKHYKEKK